MLSPFPEEKLLSLGTLRFSLGGTPVNFGLLSVLRARLELLNHLYQLSKGFRLHLFHRAAALNLHGAFRGSEFSSDLFVEHSGNNHGDYFLLARTERLESAAKVHQLHLFFAPLSIPIKCDLHCIQKILVPKR